MGGNKFEPGGSKNAEYMFIGIRPSKRMSKNTKTASILKPIWEKYFKDNYYFTNIVKTPDNENKTPTEQEVQNEICLLQQEIQDINPKKIFALGQWAYYILKEYGYDPIHVQHPAYISRFNKQLQYEEEFKKHCKNE